MAEGTHPQPTLFLILADEVTSGQITVPLDAFVGFCFTLEQELHNFEDRFAKFAAPSKSDLRSQWR